MLICSLFEILCYGKPAQWKLSVWLDGSLDWEDGEESRGKVQTLTSTYTEKNFVKEHHAEPADQGFLINANRENSVLRNLVDIEGNTHVRIVPFFSSLLFQSNVFMIS